MTAYFMAAEIYVRIGVAWFLLSLALARDRSQHALRDWSPAQTDEQRLLNRLMRNYDHRTRPVYNASHPVVVKLGITLNQIFDLDERNQVLTTHIWLDQEWKDEKLRWQPEDFNNLSTLRVPCALLWRPDIVLYNSADDYTEGFMSALAMVSHDGSVFWPPIVKLRSTCKIDITYFPFDDQTCHLKLGSWAYDGLQVDVLKRSNSIDLLNYVSNGEWQLIDVKVLRNVEYYSCCPEPYPDVTFLLHIRRRTLYYTYNVIIPCIMLSGLSLMGFWMPPEGGEKVALGMTVLLSFSVFMLLIAENMPATSFYIPLIGVYIIVAMGLTALSVVCSVWTSYIYHQGSTNRRVPNYFRTIAFNLNRIVRAHRKMRAPRPRAKRKDTRTSKCGATVNIRTPLRTSFAIPKFSVSCNTGASMNGGIEFENFNYRNASPKHVTAKIAKDAPSGSGRRCETGPSDTDRCATFTDDLLHRLDALLLKHEELLHTFKQNPAEANIEWRQISQVFDRFLFWLFLVVTTSVTIVILIFVPLMKKDPFES